MRVRRRSHPPGHDKTGFALHDDIRQRLGDKEGGGTPFDIPFTHNNIEFAFIPIVLESLHNFLPRRYVTLPCERFPCSSDHPESGINFIFDLAMQ